MTFPRVYWLGLFAASLAFCQPSQKQRDPQEVVFDAKRLKQFSNVELIDLLSQKSIEKNAQKGHGIYSLLPPDRRGNVSGRLPAEGAVQLKLDPNALDFTDAVEQELIARSAHLDLIDIFERTTDEFQQAWIVDVLAQTRLPAADSVLRRYIHGATDEPTTYLALKYFGSVCDQEALRILNKHYFQYHTSSMEWASIVRSFGECKYKPAVPKLVETVSAASMNLGYASHLSLLDMYPDAKIDFRDPMVTRKAWEKYLTHHR